MCVGDVSCRHGKYFLLSLPDCARLLRVGLGDFMSGTRPAVWMIVLGCMLAGCAGQRDANSNATIQRAIEQHLSSRAGLDASKMLIEVQQVKISGERAQAEVIFHSRDDPQARMAFSYELRREGGEWKVENGRPSAAASPHPDGGSGAEEGSTLPPGHPPAEGNPR